MMTPDQRRTVEAEVALAGQRLRHWRSGQFGKPPDGLIGRLESVLADGQARLAVDDAERREPPPKAGRVRPPSRKAPKPTPKPPAEPKKERPRWVVTDQPAAWRQPPPRR